MKVTTPLTRGWTMSLNTTRHLPAQAPQALLHGGVPATVPGCVHTDLLTAGLIPDPFIDRNEVEVAWVGRADWTYRTVLPPVGDHERTDLVFDGLDTVADVRLGSVSLGRTRNMHRSYRFDVTEALADGAEPALDVEFTSAYEEAEAVRAELGPRPNAYPEPFNYVRKMASSFGWDWGPTLVTAGIWRQARLESWSTARIAEVRPEVTVDAEGTGRVLVRAEVERTATGAARALRVAVEVAGVLAHADLPEGATTADVEVVVADAELWWPRGYGEQSLYACTVTLTDTTGAEPAAPLDTWERRVGFRTVELNTAPDAAGSGYTLVINGEHLFVRGVNWIPDDTLVTRVDGPRYRRRLEQATAAGVDLVRVWGGGIYENEEFYDACDELGLLVWQDFLFACAAYPEEEPLRSEVESEARENVVRLMPHPSLVLWNGNNENLWGFRDWDWEPELDGKSWGEGYYLDLLPRVVAHTDPTRPYWAGSPWSGSRALHPNDPDHGTSHSWEVWNRIDYSAYLDDVPRFVAEFGWQAPPAYATVRRSVTDEPLTADSPGMLHHQKAEDGNGKLDRGLLNHFDAPRDFDTWHYLTQVNQARAIATGVEHWRSHWPVCAGTILWQLNDCWPVTSWAAIDGDEREKPLYHELKRLYADRLLTLQRRDGRLVLAAVNQSGTAWTCRPTVRRMDADGAVRAEHHESVTLGPRAVALIPLPDDITEMVDSSREFIVADADQLRALHFATPDRLFAYPAAKVTTQVATAANLTRVTVTAHTLVRDLLLQADRLSPDAHADRGLMTLLPGESVEVTVHGWSGGTAEDLSAVLRCVNASDGLGSSGDAPG
ncbi:glycosyl hydrolase 2 galactose-binding domain-containing protein [Streptomyces sp. ITFR-6]|uniref:glycoside hydrolase family 2 protein n=1 Tax=Streptomyces sp. ITFR-6 TaxID=3075197 RepID=UPI00288C2BB0|nr:glycoside hydrolase family 2 protein [Streptomyces sp. ITFR-6]WNI32688.1 glycoside hydrolase family 2 protein [Streptomyces sp. ITFR-6]